MVTLPTVQDLGPRPVMRPQRGVARISVQSATAVSDQVAGLGADLVGIGDQIYDRESSAAAKERDAYVAEQIRTLFYDPDNGYMGKQGRDAATMREEVHARLKAIEEAATQGLNAGARQKLESALKSRLESARQSVDVHAMNGTRAWEDGASTARVASLQMDAAFDLAKTEESVAAIKLELRGQAARNGWSTEQLALEERKAIGDVYADQIRRVASLDPELALDYLGQYRDQLLPNDLISLESALIPEVKRTKGRRAGAAAAEGTIAVTRVADAGAGFTTIELADGQVVRREGTRAWRNNNPGNIEFGDFARRMGAVGTDGRFAVFPTYEAGRNAKEALIFESPSYRNLSLGAAISRYAPSFENDTGAYIRNVAEAAGVSPFMTMSEMTPTQRSAVMDAMEEVEGFREGAEIGGTSRAPGGIDALLEIKDPVERAAAIEEYNLRIGVSQAESKARSGAAAQQAYDFILSGGSVADLPFEVKSIIGREETSALTNFERNMKTGQPQVTDPETYVGLMTMASDPTRRGEFLQMNPLQYRDKLDDADFNRIVQMQAEIRSGQGAPTAPSVSTVMSVADASLQAAGITKKDAPEEYAQFQAGLTRWITANPDLADNPAKLQEEISRRLLPVVLDPRGLMNKQKGPAFTIDLDGDPLDPADDVTPSMLRGGALTINGTAVSDAMIEEFATGFEGIYGRAPTVQELVDGLTGSGLF